MGKTIPAISDPTDALISFQKAYSAGVLQVQPGDLDNTLVGPSRPSEQQATLQLRQGRWQGGNRLRRFGEDRNSRWQAPSSIWVLRSG